MEIGGLVPLLSNTAGWWAGCISVRASKTCETTVHAWLLFVQAIYIAGSLRCSAIAPNGYCITASTHSLVLASNHLYPLMTHLTGAPHWQVRLRYTPGGPLPLEGCPEELRDAPTPPTLPHTSPPARAGPTSEAQLFVVAGGYPCKGSSGT